MIDQNTCTRYCIYRLRIILTTPARMKLYARVRMSSADDIKRTCADDTPAVVILYPVRMILLRLLFISLYG